MQRSPGRERGEDGRELEREEGWAHFVLRQAQDERLGGVQGLEVGLELGVAGEFGDFADEVADRGEGFAKLDEFVVDGADGSGAVGVGAVEGEVGLVEFSDVVAVFEE